MRLIPSNFESEILELLKEGKTPAQISTKLNLVYCSTQQLCNKLGYKFRPNQGNIRYFQYIDSHLKAYFLGFIAADGAIVQSTKSTQTLTITIHSKDRCILDKFKEELECENTIKNINTPMGFDKTRNVDHVRFTLSNKEMIQDLNKLGIYQRKSMTIGNIINNIPYEYRDSFIIGYFDGDGSITLPVGKIKKSSGIYYPSHSIHVHFRGTKEFLEGIISHLNIKANLLFNKTFVLSICKKKDVIRFYNCYNNLTFYLLRKYNKFSERINHNSYQKIM